MKTLANKSIKKQMRYARRKHRTNVVSRLTASVSQKPRLIVNKSNTNMQAQIVDIKGKILAFATSIKEKGTKSEQAYATWEALAKVATKNGVTAVVFDRNGHLYHGRVKQLAEWARAGGLEF